MKQREDRGSDRGKGALPRARKDGVLVLDVAEEVLVYDEALHKAHCLNPAAALVWRHLDGRTSVGALVTRLRREMDMPADEDTVWLAVTELHKAGLLEDGFELPSARAVSRRRALRRLGVAAGTGAVLLPAVSTVLAPPVHAQASAQACGTPEPNCATFSCPGQCACVGTTEGATVCVEPNCNSQTTCASSAGCPPGTVCMTLLCCGDTPFCVSIAPVGTICTPPVGLGPGTWGAAS
jgi:hypothetical protein